jgi:hypothetical protein
MKDHLLHKMHNPPHIRQHVSLHKNDKDWIYNFSSCKNDMEKGSNLRKKSIKSVFSWCRVQNYDEMTNWKRTQDP